MRVKPNGERWTRENLKGDDAMTWLVIAVCASIGACKILDAIVALDER